MKVTTELVEKFKNRNDVVFKTESIGDVGFAYYNEVVSHITIKRNTIFVCDDVNRNIKHIGLQHDSFLDFEETKRKNNKVFNILNNLQIVKKHRKVIVSNFAFRILKLFNLCEEV